MRGFEKGGKRYRYYISSRLITGSRSDAPGGIRVPAAEIESGVIERVRQFLTNGAAVFEALQHLELDVGHAQQLMRRAQEIADTLPNSRRSDLATVLRTLISHIEVQSDQISIALQPAGLLTLLRGLMAVAAPVANDTATETAAPLVVRVPLLRRRAGRDTRLLMDEPMLRLKPGSKLMRAWRGKTHTVPDNGFEHHGKRYTSLTQVASALTGTHWSGPRFFGLVTPQQPTRGRKSGDGSE